MFRTRLGSNLSSSALEPICIISILCEFIHIYPYKKASTLCGDFFIFLCSRIQGYRYAYSLVFVMVNGISISIIINLFHFYLFCLHFFLCKGLIKFRNFQGISRLEVAISLIVVQSSAYSPAICRIRFIFIMIRIMKIF